MGLPSINIEFKTAAATAIGRSQKGTVAVILRDSEENRGYTILNATQVPKTLGVANQEYLKRAFFGYITPPRKVLAYVIGSEAEIGQALTYFETQKFDYLVGPPDVTSSECGEIKSWIASMRLEGETFKAVLPNTAADDEGVVNFATEGINDGEKIYTSAQYCSRIAGLIAGTPMTISCTYATLPEVADIKRLTKEEADAAINAGKFILIHDGEKVKVGRGVNSLVTTTQDKGTAFKKIKIVEAVDMIRQDIRMTAQDSYIGKFANSYDNKCLLMMAIKGYFEQLELDGILESRKSSVAIDMAAQVAYLTGIGVNTELMSEQEIKEANTADKVFLTAAVNILDAIEDIDLEIVI